MTPKYYVPSNRVGLRLFVVFPVVGGGLALLLGLLYAFASGLITQVFEERAAFIIATPLFGGGLALAGRAVCYLGQVRRASIRLPILIAVGIIGYYFSWQFYLVMMDHPEIFDPVPVWVMSPARVLHAMAQLASNQGAGLALSWLLEMAVIFGMIVYLHESDDDAEIPFCERCSKWAGVVFNLELASWEAKSAAEHLKRGEVTALSKLHKRPHAVKEWALVRIYRCPCGESRHVCVHQAKLVVGKSASAKYTHYTPGAANHLVLDPGSPDETHYTPVLVNLVLDEPQEQALEAVKPI